MYSYIWDSLYKKRYRQIDIYYCTNIQKLLKIYKGYPKRSDCNDDLDMTYIEFRSVLIMYFKGC